MRFWAYFAVACVFVAARPRSWIAPTSWRLPDDLNDDASARQLLENPPQGVDEFRLSFLLTLLGHLQIFQTGARGHSSKPHTGTRAEDFRRQ
jgi:hypothetical protein